MREKEFDSLARSRFIDTAWSFSFCVKGKFLLFQT